jgi:CubicO group peptidase (beta-lactamase class C family)
MIRHLFIFSFFSLFLSQTSVRFNQEIPIRDYLDLDGNSYRDESELLQFIETTMDLYSIPGLSISIVKDNNIVWSQHFGYANINENIFVDENTMFILSSISKTITATALMQLYEQDLFLLDDDIDDYLPFNVNHSAYPLAPVTFKMLLSHTSGIKDNWGVMPYYDGDSDIELVDYLNEYFTPGSEIYNNNLNFTSSIPGSSYNYSNIGVGLIGLLVEQISGQSFNEYCNEYIFEPLEMNNSYWFLSEIENLDQVALPYQFIGGNGDTCFEIGCGFYDESNPCFCDLACTDYGDCCSDYEDVCGEDGTGSSSDNLVEHQNYGYSDYPSGQLRATSNDLAKFMAAYINNGIYNGVRILGADTVELIKTIHYPSVNMNQGLIWYYKDINERTLFGHNGGDIGSLTEMFISFSDNLGVVLLSNSSNYDALIQIENSLLDFAEQTDFTVSGDINSDEVINIQDIVLAISLVLNTDYSYLADLNSDDIVDVLDIVQLVNIILN